MNLEKLEKATKLVSTIGQKTRFRVVDLIRKSGPLTALDIETCLDLQDGTVSYVLRELRNQKIIIRRKNEYNVYVFHLNTNLINNISQSVNKFLYN
jgi:predicted transcriptional regulator